MDKNIFGDNLKAFAGNFSLDNQIPKEISTKIITMAKGSEFGIFVILFSILIYYIRIYTDDEDVTVYLPPLKNENQARGKLAKIQCHMDHQMQYRDLLNTTKNALHQSVNNQQNDIPDLQMIAPQIPVIVASMEGVFQKEGLQEMGADITFVFAPDASQITCRFGERIIVKNHNVTCIFVNNFLKVLASIISTPNIKLSDIQVSIEKNLFSHKQGDKYYQVSSVQKRLYIIDQLNDPMVAYNVPIARLIEGKLDYKKITYCFNTIMKRHDALRMYFEVVNGEVVQRIADNIEVNIEYIDAGVDNQNKIDEIIEACIRPFILSQAPLFRVYIIQINMNKHILLFDVHHIICDGASVDIILKEFIKLYDGATLPLPKLQYQDYVMWYDLYIKNSITFKQGKYWRNLFKDGVPVLNLPTDFGRPLKKNFDGESLYFPISEELWNQLNQLALKTSSTIYMMLLAVYHILLYKYTGQDDIVVGCPVSGRLYAGIESIVGMFVNTIVIRNKLSPTQTFYEFLADVKQNCVQVYDNQGFEFEMIIETLGLKDDPSRNPLFDTMFILQNSESDKLNSRDLVLQTYKINYPFSKFDIIFEFLIVADKMNLRVEYSKKLFKQCTIQQMAGHFINICRQICDYPEKKINQINILSSEEEKRIAIDFNNTSKAYPKDISLTELFEQQAAKSPLGVALAYEGGTMNYDELNKSANKVAWFLRSKGIGPNDLVGINVERDALLIIGILGILKSGAGYLPIETSYPAERIKYFLENSNVSYVLSNKDTLVSGLDYQGEMINITNILAMEDISTCNLHVDYDLSRIIYVIYTSGSTGNPKGVMVKLNSFVNLMNWYVNEFNINENDCNLLIAPVSFDLAQKNLYATLLTGGRLYLYPPDAYNYNLMSAIIEKEGVTLINCAPAAFYPLLDMNKDTDFYKLRHLRCTFLGGEALNLIKLKEWADSRYFKGKILNTYGPTECTDIATYYDMSNMDPEQELSVPIGKPIDNVEVYILDKDMNPVPVGVDGELYIGGVGVSKGYLKDEAQTNAKFIEFNHFFNSPKKLYRTGDQVRWLPDGNIDFKGRIDFQVKIRGFRIELGEIESIITKYEGIRTAIALVRENENKDKYLCAYYTGEHEISVMDLRAFLLTQLPEYMIPAYFLRMEQIPLTPNGKINRQALPEPNFKNTEVEFTEPTTATEKELVEIWRKVIGIDRVGINNNFFELGGHSIKAMQLSAEIYNHFKINLPVGSIFRLATVTEMAQFISGEKGKEEKTIYDFIDLKPVKEGCYPASSSQKRMYILNQFFPDETGYNAMVAFSVFGQLDKHKMEEVFEQLVKRHESLRTSFELLNGALVQRIHDEVKYGIDYAECKEQEIYECIKKFNRPFNLSTPPLIRTKIIKVEEKYHIIVIDTHHIISDAVTNGILLEEMLSLYHNKELSEVTLQYKNFAAWQNYLLSSDLIKHQEEYWLEVFNKEITSLKFPFSRERPSRKNYRGDSIRFRCNEELVRKLRIVAAENEATLYIILFMAYNLLISIYSGQENIVIGCPIAGRQHVGVEEIVGVFINTLPIRNYVKLDMTLKELIAAVRDNVIKAFDNQDYQLDELIDKLKIERDFSRNPLFDTIFNMISIDFTKILRQGELDIELFNIDSNTSLFDLTLEAQVVEDGLDFTLLFDLMLFERNNIERMAEDYIELLHMIVKDKEVTIESIKSKLLFC